MWCDQIDTHQDLHGLVLGTVSPTLYVTLLITQLVTVPYWKEIYYLENNMTMLHTQKVYIQTFVIDTVDDKILCSNIAPYMYVCSKHILR